MFIHFCGNAIQGIVLPKHFVLYTHVALEKDAVYKLERE